MSNNNYIYNTLKNKYKINPLGSLLKYYYIDAKINCCRIDLKPLFDNIQEYDYLKPLQLLAEYYKPDLSPNIYDEIYDELKNQNFKNKMIDYINYDKKLWNSIDHMILQYVKCMPKLFIITLWPRVKNSEAVVNFLKKKGNVYCVKEFNIAYNTARNLIYAIYSDTNRLANEKEIEEKLEYIQWGMGDNIVKIILFDNINNLSISGSKAPFKQEIRLLCAAGDFGKNRGDDFVHINDTFIQTVEYCKLYFHKNSMKFLKRQNLTNFLADKNMTSRMYFQTFKNWLYKEIDPIDWDRFVIYGGSTLYTHGVRPIRDIDGMIMPYREGLRTKNIREKVFTYLYDRKTKFFFLDFGMANSEPHSSWKEVWDIKNKVLFDFLKVKNLNSLCTVPKYYYYYQGIKILTLKYDYAKRYIRRRYTDYADLIALYKTVSTSKKLVLPPIEATDKNLMRKEIHKYMKQKYPELYNEQELNDILKNL